MYPPAHRRVLRALCALLLSAAALSAPGCGSSPTAEQSIERYSQKLRDTVSSRVQDEGRRGQMLTVVEQMESLQLRFNKETADFVAAYRKLNADYEASRPQFDQLFSEYNAQRMSARQQDLALHFQLASLAAADEWDAIAKAEGKLYVAANEARSSGQNR